MYPRGNQGIDTKFKVKRTDEDPVTEPVLPSAMVSIWLLPKTQTTSETRPTFSTYRS